MRTRYLWIVVVIGLLGTTLAPSASGQAQLNADRLSTLKTMFGQINSNLSQLPPNHRLLAGSQMRMLSAAHMVDRLSAAASVGKTISGKAWSQGSGDAGPGVVSVNDNSTDLFFSSYDGVTQSTTSTAMCGSQVVVGFNDTGSLLQTLAFLNTGGESMTGVAVSSDGGRTFRDIGFMNPGPDSFSLLAGDPSLTCSDSSTFYYFQSFFPGSGETQLAAIAISKSTDGGNTWADPRPAVGKPEIAPIPNTIGGFQVIHALDRPSSAIDPSNPQRIYLSYTDMDTSHTSPTCGKQTRTAIELVVSNDGGQSFGSPIIIDEVCGDNLAVDASHIAFNSHGVAYVTWERISLSGFVINANAIIPFPSGNSEVRITSVAPNGTVAPSILVDQKVFGGSTFAVFRLPVSGGLDLETDLQGQFHNFFGLGLAVDHSGGPNDGTVYVTWDDGRNKSVSDLAGFTLTPNSPAGVVKQLQQLFPNAELELPSAFAAATAIFTSGTYSYTDVLVSKSRDGVHFGPTMQVNSDQQPNVGGGHDHFQPAIATDRMGRVAICWYDRRNDPRNFSIERFCAESENGGRQWTNFKAPIKPFAPVHRTDFSQNFDFIGLSVDQSYMGDYDGLTSDFTGKTKGFIGAFQWMSSGMNPDVKSFRFE